MTGGDIATALGLGALGGLVAIALIHWIRNR